MCSLYWRRLRCGVISAALNCTLASFAFSADSALRLHVVDAKSQEPLAARVYLTSAEGTSYYFASDDPNGSAVRYEMQNWINEQSTEYHTTVSAHPSTVSLPEGNYELIVERGKTYFPITRSIEMGQDDVSVSVALSRWDDPASKGWYSGDTHLHRSVNDLKNILIAENLNVALPLTNWVTFSGTAPSAGDKNLSEIPSDLVRIDPTHVIWPRNTEYEIFTVGKKRHTLGALFALGHRDALGVGVPPWSPVVKSLEASDPDALFDMDKLDWPFAMLLPTITPNALYELSNNHVWRTEFAFRKWNTAAPAFMCPPQGTTEGGHRQWIDYTLGMYYTLLDCGFRLPPSAGTANGVHPVPAGFGRVYVHLPDGFDFRQWMHELKSGRSFVSTGPMLYAQADAHDSGHEFTSDGKREIAVSAEVISEQKLSYGELIVNGRPEELLRPQNTKTSEGAHRSVIETKVRPKRSGWFALRFWQPMPDGQVRFVHSAPWYVNIDDQPVQPRLEEKQYLVERMKSEIERSRDVVSHEALMEYVRALSFYEELKTHDESFEIASKSRPLAANQREGWLDNMVGDHRMTAVEIRRATGMEIDEAQHEIDIRRDKPTKTGFRILPYPGGRHPRVGFLDGAIAPQRETKISVFPPWDDVPGSYAVVDVPEAVFSNLGLTYLAHTHIPTIWDDKSIQLEPTEWKRSDEGYESRRKLPNGIVLTSLVRGDKDSAGMASARMQISLTNGTPNKLTGLRVQVCTMLKNLTGFSTQQQRESVIANPFIAIRSDDGDRWVVTGWAPLHRTWSNPPVPCLHSDPVFPDCGPGKTVKVIGGLWFYEGTDVASFAKTLQLPSEETK